MNVVIVDDEFLARKLLANYIAKIPQLTLLAQCSNATEVLEVTREQQVDILLLDIHMPDINGLELARMCTQVPAIIFTTAYSEYALESYELSAVDYLLKPIAFDRFQTAVEKAIAKVESATAPQAKTFLMVKADYRLYKINHEDLLYIEGQHEYVSFYTTGKRITALFSLKNLEELLPSDQFIRVHKSYIVSIPHITEINQSTVTVAGQKIPIGGIYREMLNQKLGVKVIKS